MINRPSLDQPLYLDISRYLDIFHLDTGYLNISVSKYLFLLYLPYNLGLIVGIVDYPLQRVRVQFQPLGGLARMKQLKLYIGIL